MLGKETPVSGISQELTNLSQVTESLLEAETPRDGPPAPAAHRTHPCQGMSGLGSFFLPRFTVTPGRTGGAVVEAEKGRVNI